MKQITDYFFKCSCDIVGRELILCQSCQDKFPMHKCPHDKVDGVLQHEHVKLTIVGDTIERIVS